MTDAPAHLTRRRRAATEAWELDDESVVLVHAGQPVPKPGGQDQTYPFRPHLEYYWLTERWRRGAGLRLHRRRRRARRGAPLRAGRASARGWRAGADRRRRRGEGLRLRRHADLPGRGRFTPEQRDLYEVVLAAAEEGIAGCRPGQEFRELHLRCALTLAQGLVDLGILRGDPQALVERDAHALFFPHGLGHLVGLGVRDASGYLPGRERSSRPGLRFLRIDLPLAAGFVTTIEPGLYFVPAIIDDPQRRRAYADDVDWARVDAWRSLGGVRIEDNVLVTADGPEVLTAAIPKKSAAIAW